jgi:hypothetical protein
MAKFRDVSLGLAKPGCLAFPPDLSLTPPQSPSEQCRPSPKAMSNKRRSPWPGALGFAVKAGAKLRRHALNGFFRA